jgi:DNA-binding winged helix-turn-helix (wHTH) protein
MSEPRSPDASGRLVRFGVFEFNPETGELWKAGRRRRLQEQPRQVLRLLVGHAGQLITRDELRQILWPDDTFVDVDTGLNVVVTKIRQALDDSASMPRFVETLPRRGYRFIAPVDVATPAIDPPSRSGEKPETSLQTEPVPVPHVAPAGSGLASCLDDACPSRAFTPWPCCHSMTCQAAMRNPIWRTALPRR